MKPVLIISNYDDIGNPFYGGGGAQSVHEIAKRLTNVYDITVLTGAYKGAKNCIVDGVSYRRIGIPGLNPKLGQLVFAFLLPIVAKTLTFDIWLESLTPPFSISLLPLTAGKPVIGLVHMLAGKDMRRKYRLPFDLIEQAGLRFYRTFIVTNKASAAEIKKYAKHSKIYIIPNGVAPIVRKQRLSVRPFTILSIGRIEINQKGLDLLIKAFSLIYRKYSVRLIIAGSGIDHDVKRLRSLIATERLADKVTLPGYVSGASKVDLFGKAGCVVVASRFETFSMTALDAMAAGLPLVTTPIAGLRWIPRTCRETASELSAHALARSLEKIITDQHFRKRIAACGKRYASNFDWNTATSQYRKVINTTLL